MSGADWGSAFLLKDFKNKAGIQDASEYDDDDDLYPRLSTAQRKVISRIAAIFPNALYSAPTTMTRAVDGKTYTYGTDGNGNALVPAGNVQIATTLSAFSGDYFVGWVEGRDFYDEGDRIRVVSNRSGPATLYWRGVPTAPDITTLVAPILNPALVRELISRQAVIDWGEEGGLLPAVVTAQENGWKRDFPIVMLTYRKRFKGGGGLIEPARWYLYAPDLAG